LRIQNLFNNLFKKVGDLKMFKNFKHLSIRKKLFTGFGIVCLLIIIEGVVINNVNNKTIKELTSTGSVILPHMLNYIEVKRDIELIQGWLTDISATRAAEGYDDGFKEAENYYQDALKRIDFALSFNRKTGHNQDVETLKNLKKDIDDYYKSGKNMAQAYIDEGPAAGNPMMEKFDPFAAKLASLIDQLASRHVSALNNSFRSMQLKSQTTSEILWIVMGLVLITTIFFMIVIVVPIGASLTNAVDRLRDIAEGEGDLSKRLEAKGYDEIGLLAKWFNAFIGRIHDIIVEIASNTETVSLASEEMLLSSEQLSENAEELSDMANKVAAASIEMSTNMDSVAAATEQVSTSINLVSDSASNTQSRFGEVVSSCENAKEISKNATEIVNSASKRVDLLGDAAGGISAITKVITEVAGQTDLLALNATIEAARAGEAGKGFAVVAGEIKNLAGKTAEATGDIRDKISGIQNSTEDTIQDVSKISEVITNVYEIVSDIAAVIEKQSSNATEVAQNIEQVSLGVTEINENIAKSAALSSEIVNDINSVNSVSEEIQIKGVQMNNRARELSELSVKSGKMIRLFKVTANDELVDKNPHTAERNIPDIFPWSSKLNLGIAEIDDQHKELVKYINQLYKAMKLKQGTKKSGAILKKLADYTVYHFSNEEKLFNKYGYPETKTHLKAHEILVEKVLQFKSQFEGGKAALSMELMSFLMDWLKNHILKTDKQYVPFLQKKMKPFITK
jgi:hemerythrin-like metal-binding protein